MEIIENNITVTEVSTGIQVSVKETISDAEFELMLTEFQYLEVFDD